MIEILYIIYIKQQYTKELDICIYPATDVIRDHRLIVIVHFESANEWHASRTNDGSISHPCADLSGTAEAAAKVLHEVISSRASPRSCFYSSSAGPTSVPAFLSDELVQ